MRGRGVRSVLGRSPAGDVQSCADNVFPTPNGLVTQIQIWAQVLKSQCSQLNRRNVKYCVTYLQEAANVDTLLHSTFTHRSAAETG